MEQLLCRWILDITIPNMSVASRKVAKGGGGETILRLKNIPTISGAAMGCKGLNVRPR